MARIAEDILAKSSKVEKTSSLVEPIHYDLRLSDFSDESFLGSVDIRMKALERVEVILLHGIDLAINKAEFKKEGQEAPISMRSSYDETEGRIMLEFLDTQVINKDDLFVVSLAYVAKIDNEKIQGIFRHEIRDEASVTQKLLVASNIATRAQESRIFPCINELEVKTKLTLSIILPRDGTTCLSSMPMESEKPYEDSKLRLLKFSTTPETVPYMLGLIIGTFDKLLVGAEQRGGVWDCRHVLWESGLMRELLDA